MFLMIEPLFDRYGARKYLDATERAAFAQSALMAGGLEASFCLTLAFTGARISEVLSLTSEQILVEEGAIVFETLKRRQRGIFRLVPVPNELIALLVDTHNFDAADRPHSRLWTWGRTTAWKRVKAVMLDAKIEGRRATPRAARHAFGVGAIQSSVALGTVQKWMGHARIETTAIYTNVMGKEERALAERTWLSLKSVLTKIGNRSLV